MFSFPLNEDGLKINKILKIFPISYYPHIVFSNEYNKREKTLQFWFKIKNYNDEMGYGVQEKMGCRQTVGVQEYPKKDDIISEQPLNVFFTQ